MYRPTREQIAQSREYVAGLLESHAIKSMMSGAEIAAIKDLLAATAEPSEEELVEEAERAFPKRDDNAEREGYIAGARREGRRITTPCTLCLDSGWVGGSAEVERPTRCLYGCHDRSGGIR